MKKSILLCLILLNFSFSFGQSIVTSNNVWYNFISYYSPSGFPVYGVEYIKFTNDTLINSITYKKVERMLDNEIGIWSLYGYIRENANKQVFYKINAQDPERLLYDINVQAHSLILVYGLVTCYANKNLDSMSFYVRNIDSIYIGSTYHKRLNLTMPYDTLTVFEQWIDSIGSLGGMLHNKNIYVGADYYSLQCFFKDEVLQFHDSNYTACTYITDVSEIKPASATISVFPNPVTDNATLEITGIENKNDIYVSMYNLMGKKVYSSFGTERIKIFKRDLPSGIYLYRISLGNSMIGQGKVIIN
ncbi:MAG: T9SS type A sorting domain-containing protein [Bacteroidales bacterium]|nr:T9SS type A sorting domain-containing protein [Bacteroidales bacterium]